MTTAARTIPPTSALCHSSRVLVLAAFFAIYVVWASTYLAIRFAIESIAPLVTAGIRHTTAGLVLLAWAYARGFRFRMDYSLKGALALGVLFFVIGHGTLHWAEQYVNSGLAALLIATEPTFILVRFAAEN
jgi:drug/metabolite transporter (DMT)-like permease